MFRKSLAFLFFRLSCWNAKVPSSGSTAKALYLKATQGSKKQLISRVSIKAREGRKGKPASWLHDRTYSLSANSLPWLPLSYDVTHGMGRQHDEAPKLHKLFLHCLCLMPAFMASYPAYNSSKWPSEGWLHPWPLSLESQTSS